MPGGGYGGNCGSHAGGGRSVYKLEGKNGRTGAIASSFFAIAAKISNSKEERGYYGTFSDNRRCTAAFFVK